MKQADADHSARHTYEDPLIAGDLGNFCLVVGHGPSHVHKGIPERGCIIAGSKIGGANKNMLFEAICPAAYGFKAQIAGIAGLYKPARY